MKLYNSQICGASLAALALAGCSLGDEGPPPVLPSASGAAVYGSGVSDSPVIVGEPYEIGGVTYTPSNPARYDEVGLASYYGDELTGRPTANGEPFNPSGISAAHRILPLPSYVEVTSLQTGRTILVRVNDRGPFSSERLIDLSIGAARQLGIADQGTAAVRVRRVEPIEADKARLRAGQFAEERLPASPQLLTALRASFERGGGAIPEAVPSPDAPQQSVAQLPVPLPSTVAGQPAGVGWPDPSTSPPPDAPVAMTPPQRDALTTASGSYYVQLGAFSNSANARRMAARAGSLGNVAITPAGNIQRVRLGPFPSVSAAEQALGRARSAGFGQARVFRDR